MTVEFIPGHYPILPKNVCSAHYFRAITVLGDPLSKSGNYIFVSASSLVINLNIKSSITNANFITLPGRSRNIHRKMALQ